MSASNTFTRGSALEGRHAAIEEVRGRQARILRIVVERLDGGGEPLPSDVFQSVEEELELLIDDEAIAAAWAAQDEEEAEPWSVVRPRVLK